MKLAIKEMIKSHSEHKNKFDPMVGAILVDAKGKEIGKAHRGGLRVGDHAEYTLIERLLRSKNLEGSTLYVTLEPCTTRQPPKKPCAERIISARIGKVYIGMPDPNPEIQGKGINHLLCNQVEVEFFDMDLIEEIQKENKDFIQQYDKISEKSGQEIEIYKGPSKKEKEPIQFATVDDFSLKEIKKYLKARNRPYKVPSNDLWEFFRRNEFLIYDIKNKSYIPTVGGILLLAKNPEDFLVQSKIKMEANDGKNTVTSDITGPLISITDKIEKFLNSNMRKFTEIKGFKRIDIPEYPLEALREAIVNALAHRDYNEGARIIIRLSQNDIQIRSPGLPIPPVTLEKIRKYNAPPYSRNPRISDTLSNMRLMEERGWGFKKMKRILEEHGLPPPMFSNEGGYFVVTFFARERKMDLMEISPELLLQLNKRQKKLIDFIRNRGSVTTTEYSKKFEITRKTAVRDLNKLIELNIIERIGAGSNVYYVLITK
jgi:ATP-dependent DNA helicase RecG